MSLAESAVADYEKDLEHGVAPTEALNALQQRCDAAVQNSFKREKAYIAVTLSDLADMAPQRAAAERAQAALEHTDVLALKRLPPDQQADAQELLNRYNSDGASDGAKSESLAHMKQRYPALGHAVEAKAQNLSAARNVLESAKHLEDVFESVVDRQVDIPAGIADELRRHHHPAEANQFQQTATQMYLRSIQAEIEARKVPQIHMPERTAPAPITLDI
jgi:hypothetical protein